MTCTFSASPKPPQAPSVVSRGTSSCSPRARQTRSPSDIPALRVLSRSLALPRARSTSTSTKPIPSPATAANASCSGAPESTSFCNTSARLIVAITASGTTSSTASAPGSPCSIASNADASRTALLTSSLGPAIRDQAIGQALLRLDVPAEYPSRALDGELRAGHADRPVLEPHDQLIPGTKAKLAPVRGRKRDAAVLA